MRVVLKVELGPSWLDVKYPNEVRSIKMVSTETPDETGWREKIRYIGNK